tara:strand:+ start:642 stop:941 length:300 start_codon:yes stop_codon:yes gene_type:complete
MPKFKKNTGYTPFKMKGWSPFTKTGDEKEKRTDDTYVGDSSIVTSPRLDAIETRLNKLEATDQSGMSRKQLIELHSNIEQGKKAREKELNRIMRVRSTS